MKKTKKTLDLAVSLTFLVFLFGFAAAFWIVPDAERSEEENRPLTQFPAFSWASLCDGSFSDGINAYFADQFPARDSLVGVKGAAETLALKGENNGVLLGKNGQLAVRKFDMYRSLLERTADMDYFDPAAVALSVDGLNAYAEGEVRPLVTLLPPRTVDVAASALSYPGEISDSLHRQLCDSVSEAANWIDLLPLLRERYDAGESVYYRTDHHWTALGAYLAYCEVMKGFGLESEILPRERFTVEEIPGFCGTSWSKAGCKFVEPDTLELWSLGNDAEFTTSCLSARRIKGEDGKPKTVKEVYETFPGWLNRDSLAAKDKYAAFLDGTHNEVTVFRNGGEAGERERLLVAKDSFANAMVPYLAQHFDLVIVNLAGKMTELSEYAAEYGCSRVLIVYNWENLLTGSNLAGIR